MNLEQILTPTLEQTLNTILSTLANFFGTTTSVIMENAPEWLAKYGWYITVVDNLGCSIFGGLLLGCLLGGIFLAIWEYNTVNGINAIAIIITIFILLITIATAAFITILPCILSPEIAGLAAIIKLIS